MVSDRIFAYYWNTDPDNEQTQIRIYGISIDENARQKNVCVRTSFTPYAYVELPDDNDDTVKFVQEAVRPFVVYSEVLGRAHLYNSANKSELSPFLFCQCESKQLIYDMTNKLKYGIFIPGKDRVCLKVHETQASPILQMVSLRDLPMAGWIELKDAKEVTGEDRMTNCDLEYVIKWKNLSKCDGDRVVPKSIAFDLEVNSTQINQMPSDRPGDAIFQISCVVEGYGVPRRKVLLTLAATDMDIETSELLEGVDVQVFDSEEDLLSGFIEFISEEKPNVLTGFNIFGFDIEYLMKRCIRFCLSGDLKLMGFNKEIPAAIETVKWSSSAFKNQEFKFFNWEGILLLDLLPLIQRDHKLDTYSLKNVSQVFLNNDTKDPVTYKDIFEAYRTRQKLDVVGKYCVQDSNLCMELINYFHTWTALSEMAKVCNVSMFTLYTQGQQIKTFSQVYKYCLNKNIVVDTDGYSTKISDKYTGAYVFEPVPGYYNRVCPLDFSSLYPSIIISKNICYSTIADDSVPDEDCNVFDWEDHIGCEHDPKVIKVKELTEQINKIELTIKDLMKKRDSISAKNIPPGTKVKDEKSKIQDLINIERSKQKPFQKERREFNKSKPSDREDENGNKICGNICAKRYYRFLKSHVKKGVIPTIIQNLLDSRSSVKKMMKTASPEQKLVYDKEQLAYKVSANSMYGAMGVRKGYLPFMPGAMCITYFGRQSIEKTAKTIVEKWGGELIYGDTDSNYVTFPQKRTIQETWDYAIEVADGISKEFPPPMKLEFEGTIYERFLILSKKRYMYQEIDRDGNLNKKIGKKGVILARRDNSGMMRKIYERVAQMIFDRNTKAEIEFEVIEYINNLFRNVLDYKDYVITKSIGDTEGDIGDHSKLGDYKVRQRLPDDIDAKNLVLQGRSEKDFYISQCPAHVQLAERMRNRGIPVSAGSRIEFVVVKRHSRNATLGERLEDFDTFKKYSWVRKIDTEYYLNSLINSLDQMLAVGIQNDHFVNDQYDIRMKFEKVLDQIKQRGYYKIVTK
jgi:DNA polymerase elongation subunit (family B)